MDVCVSPNVSMHGDAHMHTQTPERDPASSGAGVGYKPSDMGLS